MRQVDRLNVGIVGCGNVSTNYLTLAPQFRDIRIVAVADIDDSIARTRAAEFPVRAESVDNLITAGDIDVILNLTIPAAHYSLTRQILQAGKHAYSEKPLALTLSEGKELQDLANALDLRIGVAPDTFLGASHQLARSSLDDGLIGKVVGGTCHFMDYGMEHWHPNPDFFFRPGAGPVLDMGPYYLTNLVQLIGPARAVSAMAATGSASRTIANGPREGQTIPVETPTHIHALIEFQCGAIFTLGASWDVQTHRHGPIEIHGTAGSLYLPDPNYFGGALEIQYREGETTVLPDQQHPFGIHNAEDSQGVARANYRCAGLADMADAIIKGRPHRCNASVALHVVDMMTGILLSAEKRQWIEMTTRCERPEALSSEQAQALLLPIGHRNAKACACS